MSAQRLSFGLFKALLLMNYFELFGLQIQFKLDGSLLSSQFRELQRQFHPDKFAAASERDRLLALQKAAEINDAYQVFEGSYFSCRILACILRSRDPRRAENNAGSYVLNGTNGIEGRVREIPSLADNELALSNFESKVLKMFKHQLELLESELDRTDWEQAEDSVRKLKFIAKLQNEIQLVEEKLFG